ncbi:NAD(P)H dehydrogenase (quinone) [Paenibacillus tianmuensis]|uniref:NAD(P)H dehydrogenase (Quinone) n=1 Tax=Paenibacillus tianmuensis TaxID=624147 RepID=A0A1G4STP1_9BACL|nr:NAD(P)H-dependent oxidoreductase [Paenibacillus tianmuensis]SCW72540.1 NAD(P)H dehydrogenase (quinone) [Paenibacillus tianmuensis]
MKVLIVYAHPEQNSFNATMKNLAVETLTGAGHQVQISDLYTMKFNPIADYYDFMERKNSEFLSLSAEQMNSSIHKRFAEEIQQEQDKVLWADLILFQFPVWWFSMPAIMKGWVDRVFAYGFAYGHIDGVPQNLSGRKAVCIMTTGASEESYSLTGQKGPIRDWIKHIEVGMLEYSHIKVLNPFVVYQPEYISDEQRISYLDRYKNYLLDLEAM